MRLKSLTTVLILAGVLVIILSAASVPVQASTPSLSDPPPAAQKPDPLFPAQSSSCMSVVQSAAEQAGVQGEISWSNSGDDAYNGPDRFLCSIMYVRQRENFETTLTELGLLKFTDVYGTFIDGVCRYTDDVATENSYLFDFHGYYALMETVVGERTYPDENGGIVHHESKMITWYMDGGGEYCAHLSVRTHTPNVEAYGHAEDPTPIAEALLAVAEANLPLLPPVSDGSSPGADPILPGENPLPSDSTGQQGEAPLQPENSSDADAGDTNNSLFGIPLPVVLGSFGIPIIGAAAGAIASAVMGALGTATSSASGSSAGASQGSKPKEHSSAASDSEKPREGQPPASEEEIPAGDSAEPPPPDADAPPLETQEPAAEEQPAEDPVPVEAETEAGTEQETPDSEVDSSNDSQQDTPAAENTEAKETSTEPEKPEPKKKAVSPEQIQLVKDDLKALNQKLLDENCYVLNPVQGDPTLIVHGITITTNKIWDYTGGWVTGSNGLTCEGYVNKTRDQVRQILKDRVPGAVLEEIVFYEDSTWNNDRSFCDRLDSFVDDNHILFKVTLPDGSEWAIDFHQHNNGSGPIFRTWEGGKKPWKDYLGSEFRERPHNPK